MKTILKLLPVALVGLLLSACASSTEMNSIHIGMNKAEVLSALGNPDSTSGQGNVEYLTYYLVINDQEGSVRDNPYMVRLVDGKVESFGRFRQLEDLYLRPVATNGSASAPVSPLMSPYGLPTQSAPATAAVAPAPSDIASQLEKLKELKDQGVLSEEEFEKAKAKVLAGQQ